MRSRFRLHSLPVAVALTACVALAAGPAPVAAKSTVTLKREVRKLKIQHKQLRYTLEVVRGQRTAARERVETLETKLKAERTWTLAHLRSQGSEIRRQERAIDRLTVERDQALAGLPEAIRAVPLADFGRLVFSPARQAWPCDQFLTAPGAWSLAFRSSAFCP